MINQRPVSHRQMQVVELAAQGLTDKEIAVELGVAEGTLRTYWDRLRHRFAARSRSEIIVKALSEVAEANARSMILHKLPLYVWTATADGYVDYCNEWFESEGGIPVDQAVGKGCTALMPDHELEESRIRWQLAQANCEPYEAQVHFKSKRANELRPHKIRLTPIKNADGEVVKWFGYGRELAGNADEQLLRFLKGVLEPAFH